MTHDSKELPDLTPEFLQLAAANLERVFMDGANLTDGQLKVVNQSAAYLKIIAARPAPQSTTPQQSADAVKQSFFNYCLNAGVGQ